MDNLIEHLVENHNQSISVTTKNLHSFMQWKEEMELKSSSLALFFCTLLQSKELTTPATIIIAIELANIIRKEKVNEISRFKDWMSLYCLYKSTEILIRRSLCRDMQSSYASY